MPELRETVLLDIAAAQRQITQLEAQLDALASPVVVPVEVEGTAAIQDLRRQVDQAGGVVDVDVDTAGVSEGQAAFQRLERSIDETGDQLDEAKARAAALRKELDETGKQGVTAFGNLKQAIGPLIATFAAGVGIREVVQQLGQAVTAASDLEQAVGGLDAVFGKAGKPLQDFADDAAQALGLGETAFLQLGARLGGQLQTFGFAADEAAQETQRLIGLGADLAATYGGPVSDAVEAISSLLRGETNPIERYAIAINQTAINAKALALGLAESAGQITLQDKAVAALALLNEQSANAQGQFGREAATTAGKVERLRAELENARAEVGEALIPAFEELIGLVPDLLEAVTELAPAFGLVGDAFGLALANATPLLEIVGGLAAVVGFLADQTERLPDGGILGGVGDGLGAAASAITAPLGLLVDQFTDIRDLLTQGITTGDLQEELDAIAERAALGADSTRLLGEAFGRLKDEGVDAVSVLEQIAAASGVSDQELSTFLTGLIRNGRLSADELRAVKDILDGLFDVDTGGVNFERQGRGAREAADNLNALNLAATDLATSGADRALLNLATGVDAVTEASGALPPFIGDLNDLQRAADDAGVGVLAFLQSIDDADNITIDLSQVETDLLGLIETLGRASFDLSVNIGEAFGVGGTIDEETQKIPADVATFLETLQSDIEEQTDFEIDLSAIQVVAPDLAQALADQGIDVAADIAAAFAADPEAAAKAQELLDGTAEQLATGTAEAYAGFLKDLTPQQVADLGVFGAENFISPAVQAQLAETADTLAKELLDLIDNGISGQTIAPEILIDLSQAQIDLSTLPSLQGNPVSVRVPGAQTETGSTGSPTGGGGVRDQALIVNINNATTNDVTGSGAQAAQTIASVSRNLWRGN